MVFSTLHSLATTRPTTQSLGANIAEASTYVFHSVSQIQRWKFVHKKPSIPNSQFAEDVVEQTENIFQDVRKNAWLAYIKNEACWDENAILPN